MTPRGDPIQLDRLDKPVNNGYWLLAAAYKLEQSLLLCVRCVRM